MPNASETPVTLQIETWLAHTRPPNFPIRGWSDQGENGPCKGQFPWLNNDPTKDLPDPRCPTRGGLNLGGLRVFKTPFNRRPKFSTSFHWQQKHCCIFEKQNNSKIIYWQKNPIPAHSGVFLQLVIVLN